MEIQSKENSKENSTGRKCNYSKVAINTKKINAISKQISPVNDSNAYLENLTIFCKNVSKNEALSLGLNSKQVMEIVLVADKLSIPRIDALKAWKISKQGVVINPDFLLSVFVGLNVLAGSSFYTNSENEVTYILHIAGDKNKEVVGQASHDDYVNNSIWKTNSKKAISELALMKALRKAFPSTLIGIVCSAEIAPSLFDMVSAFCIAYFTILVTAVKKIRKKEVNNKAETNIAVDSTNRSSENEDLFLDLDSLEVESSYKN